jgi:MFS family permease
MQTYLVHARDTLFPLAVFESGVIVGGFLWGRVADHRSRVAWFAMACVGSGVLAALVFTALVPPWATVVLAFVQQVSPAYRPR